MKIIEILSRLKFLPSSRHLNCQFVREIAVAFPLKCEIVVYCTLDVFCDRRREFGAAVAANGQCDLDQHTRKVHCAECADGLKTVANFFQPGRKCAGPPVECSHVRVDFLELTWEPG